MSIFDLDNIADLPESLAEELTFTRKNKEESKILSIFFEAEKLGIKELNIDSIQVAYYRKYGEALKRVNLVSRLYRMKSKNWPRIEKIKKTKRYKLKVS